MTSTEGTEARVFDVSSFLAPGSSRSYEPTAKILYPAVCMGTNVWSIAFSADRRYFAVSSNRQVAVCDAITGERLKVIPGLSHATRGDVVFDSTNSSRVIHASDCYLTVHTWDEGAAAQAPAQAEL